MKRKKESQSHLAAKISTELESAADAAKQAAIAHQAHLESSCFLELSLCTPKTGIAEALNSQIDAELAMLRKSSAELDAAQRITANMADELSARRQDTRKAVNRHWYQPNPPANSIIDREEKEKSHFATGMSLYKLALIFIIGSFAGVVVETLWCILKNGYYESRVGLLYGPFSPLYGLGAAVLSLALYRFRNRGKQLSFLGGFAVGTVVEYVCSWWQEWAFGSKSWDYSQMPFNINGRVCLLYSLFWGVLGVIWIKDIYPRMSKWILRIPQRAGIILTWALTVFMIADCAVSGLAVRRWSERVQGIPASNAYEAFMDRHYPDERMEGIWANMDFNVESPTTEGEESP